MAFSLNCKKLWMASGLTPSNSNSAIKSWWKGDNKMLCVMGPCYKWERILPQQDSNPDCYLNQLSYMDFSLRFPLNNLLFNFANYFLTRKISCFRYCYNKVSYEALIHVVYIKQNSFWHRLCWTKPIPDIGYVGQNLFLA